MHFSGSFGEVGLDGFLATVAEGRVAHVVGQTGRRDDGAYLLEERAGEFGMAVAEDAPHVVAERHAHAGHLQGMGEAVVNEDAARQGEHLCLVLQPAEGSREDEAVVVALELRSVVVALGVAILLPESLVGNEL